MADACQWGILGLGRIAKKFAVGLGDTPGATLLACGSRSQEKADTFGEEHDVERCYGSYEELVADPDIDAIYVATPHPMHCENAILAMRAGKAVLCEKPFAMNAMQVRDMIATARETETFLMEGMWTRFLPHMVKLKELVADGAIGRLRMLQADFGFRADLDPQSRLFDLALGGGALLDVGIYPISLAFYLLGRPMNVQAVAHLGQTGVDEHTAVLMKHQDGAVSVLSTACRVHTTKHAVLMGEEGQLRVNEPWWGPNRKIKLIRDGKKTVKVKYKGNGFNYEAAEVARCLAAGLKESPIMPLAESLAIMETLDQIREQLHLAYPGEWS